MLDEVRKPEFVFLLIFDDGGVARLRIGEREECQDKDESESAPFGRVLGDLVLVKIFLALLLDELKEQPQAELGFVGRCGENLLFEDAIRTRGRPF